MSGYSNTSRDDVGHASSRQQTAAAFGHRALSRRKFEWLTTMTSSATSSKDAARTYSVTGSVCKAFGGFRLNSVAARVPGPVPSTQPAPQPLRKYHDKANLLGLEAGSASTSPPTDKNPPCPPEHNGGWTDDDKQELLDMRSRKISWAAIAQTLGRTEAAVKSKHNKLRTLHRRLTATRKVAPDHELGSDELAGRTGPSKHSSRPGRKRKHAEMAKQKPRVRDAEAAEQDPEASNTLQPSIKSGTDKGAPSSEPGLQPSLACIIQCPHCVPAKEGPLFTNPFFWRAHLRIKHRDNTDGYIKYGELAAKYNLPGTTDEYAFYKQEIRWFRYNKEKVVVACPVGDSQSCIEDSKYQNGMYGVSDLREHIAALHPQHEDGKLGEIAFKEKYKNGDPYKEQLDVESILDGGEGSQSSGGSDQDMTEPLSPMSYDDEDLFGPEPPHDTTLPPSPIEFDDEDLFGPEPPQDTSEPSSPMSYDDEDLFGTEP